MPRSFFRQILTVGLILTACATGGSEKSSGANPDQISREEIHNTAHTNPYSLIQALRPRWLEMRAQSVRTRVIKKIYLDDQYFGDLSSLRQITLNSIESLHYYDGPSATQRWGTGHSAGVIQIRARKGTD